MGDMDKQPLRMQGLGEGRGMLRSGGRGLGFSGDAPARRHDACNARWRYLEKPKRKGEGQT